MHKTRYFIEKLHNVAFGIPKNNKKIFMKIKRNYKKKSDMISTPELGIHKKIVIFEN